MDDFHGLLVLLVYAMLVLILHMLVQDLMEGAGLDRVEQFLESELLR
jgi:hypothetical protein